MREVLHGHATYLSPRIQAIQVPCPCSGMSAQVASLLATAGLSIIFLMWSIGSWMLYSAVDELKAFVEPSTSAFSEMRNMSDYILFGFWFWATLTIVSFAAFITSCFPRADVAKHLSRTIWIAWGMTWFLSVYGMVAHLSADSWLQAGCDRGDPCEASRQRLQIWLMIDLFVTLALVFWFALVYSAFVHTLHPHLFHQGDVDSELDEYDHALLLEEELRHSDHPLAGDALEWLQTERLKNLEDSKTGGVGSDRGGGLRERSPYKSRLDDIESEFSESGSDVDEVKDRQALIGRSERGGGGTSISRSVSKDRKKTRRDRASGSSSSEGEQSAVRTVRPTR